MAHDGRTPGWSWVGDRHLRVSLGDGAASGTHRRVRAALESVRRASIPGLIDATPAYGTLLLAFDIGSLDAKRAEAEVERSLVGIGNGGASEPTRVVEIPVCYEGECAPDIDEVGRLHGLTEREVAAMHAGAEYTVCFLGFMPGFGYLEGLPERLATPRLDRPRVRVPAGSVGIAGGQTGVYPRASPGGWRLIGRTPRVMFDARRDPPSVLEMGDRVRFVSIGPDRFRRMMEGRE
jgi:inhibitor of KinA